MRTVPAWRSAAQAVSGRSAFVEDDQYKAACTPVKSVDSSPLRGLSVVRHSASSVGTASPLCRSVPESAPSLLQRGSYAVGGSVVLGFQAMACLSQISPVTVSVMVPLRQST